MTDERDPPFNPELADDRLAAWIDGELSGKDLDRFEAELRVNKRLREQAESYRSFVQSMQGALQQPLGSVDVADRVIAALQRPVALAKHRSMVLPWLLSACVAAGLLTAVWIMQGDPPCPPEVRDSATASESSKVDKAAGMESERMGELDASSRSDMEKRKAAVAAPDQQVQESGKPEQDPSVAKPAAEKEGKPSDVAVLKDQTARADQKQEEAKNKTGSDDFWQGAQREGRQVADQDKAKKAVEDAPPPASRPAGQSAAGSKTPPEPGAAAPQPGRGAAGEQLDQDKAVANPFSRDGYAKAFGSGALDLAAATMPSVQVVVLTRRGTIDELRRNLEPRERNADNERTRQQKRGRAEANLVEEQLAQQFPSLSLAQTDSLQARASRLQQTWANNGPPLQLYSLGIADVKAMPFAAFVDQGREGTGNRMPADESQARYRNEALQRLLPEGTRANALYVEGEPARMQDFLKQVGTWAANNDLQVATDELPATEVENLKLSQMQSQLTNQQQVQEPKTNVPAPSGGGGGRALGGPAGPATPAPAGPSTGGPAPKSAPVPVPGGPVPQPAPTRQVLLLFREQTELPANKR